MNVEENTGIATIGQPYVAAIDLYETMGANVTVLPGFPKVRLIDNHKQILLETFAAESGIDTGVYTCTLHIPDMDLEERKRFKVLWRVESPDGKAAVYVQELWVQPNVETEFEDPVLLHDETQCEVYLPVLADSTADISVSFYQSNRQVRPAMNTTSGVNRSVFDTVTKLTLDLDTPLPPSLNQYQAIVVYKLGGKTKRMMFELWVVTPSMLEQCDVLERYLNKAKLENAIPSLQWKQSDLLMYLQRGLARYNMLGGIIFRFNGLNMRGMVAQHHNYCAMYEAVLAQGKAEGDLAFDFSGQAVTLTVQRQEALNEMRGALDTELDTRIPAEKKLLGRYGITGGDGSAGELDGSGVAFDRQVFTNLSQSPTTQVVWQRPYTFNTRFRMF